MDIETKRMIDKLDDEAKESAMQLYALKDFAKLVEECLKRGQIPIPCSSMYPDDDDDDPPHDQ
ncbi:MAG: hypothetical protein PWP23_2962 [Candidatus Sumerlaeota bacterium]|jgi:hypothetical protein|nr:hypothetical protein [Candidatus Sumerlaeota bacterium]